MVRFFNITDIDWDVDNEEDFDNLPTEVAVEVDDTMVDDIDDDDEIIAYVSEYLSDTYGFCHNGFTIDADLD